MKKQIMFALLFVVGGLSFINNANATLTVGGLGGFSSSVSASTSTTPSSTVNAFGWGGRVDYKVMDSFSVGAEFIYQNTTPSGSTSTSSVSIVVADLDYNLDSVLAGLFVGGKAGVALNSFTGNSTASSFAGGGELGWDYAITPDWSVGPQLNYLYVAAPTVGGVTGVSANVFQALASIKYKFSSI